MDLDINKYKELNNSFNYKLVFRIGDDAGFFSEYNNMILAIHYCLVNKIQFVLNSYGANFSFSDGWCDYFVPFCDEDQNPLHSLFNCRYSKAPRIRGKIYKLKYLSYQAYLLAKDVDYITYEVFDKIRKQSTEEIYKIPEIHLSGYLLENCQILHKMIWKYQPGISKLINERKNQMKLDRPYVGFHIRSGDKSREHQLYKDYEYIKKAQQITGITDGFILTDDYKIINSLQEEYSKWNFFTFCQKYETGYSISGFLKKTKEEKHNSLLNLFASMDILECADFFIGTYSTNPGMNMGFRMNKSKMHCLDFDNWLIW